MAKITSSMGRSTTDITATKKGKCILKASGKWKIWTLRAQLKETCILVNKNWLKRSINCNKKIYKDKISKFSSLKKSK